MNNRLLQKGAYGLQKQGTLSFESSLYSSVFLEFEKVHQQELRDREEDLRRLRLLRPIDDDFFRCLAKRGTGFVQNILRILLPQIGIRLTGIETQKDFKRLLGARSIVLDVYAADYENRRYDLEIERSRDKANLQRARYYASTMDIENLDVQQNFEELPETYTIFITEKDYFKIGKPFYRIERVNLDDDEHSCFLDGSHILYVNGEYRDDSDFGKLMHDFSCSDPDEMYLEFMKETVRYFKANVKGAVEMCEIFDEVRRQGEERGIEQGISRERVGNICSLMENLHMSLQQAMDALNIPKGEQKEFTTMIG